MGGLLFNPVTLTALLVAVGVGGAIWGIRKLWKWGRTRVTGGEKFKDKHDELDKKLKDAGMDIAGAPNQFKGRSGAKRMGELENKGRTEEQQKLWEEVEAERKRINGIRDAMRKEMNDDEKEWRDSVSGQGRQKGKKLQSAEKKGELAEKKAQIRSKYEAMIDTGVSISSGDGSNVGSSASGESAANGIGPAPDTEGNISVIPNFTKGMDETIKKGMGQGVESLKSGNSDNRYLLDAKLQYNTFV